MGGSSFLPPRLVAGADDYADEPGARPKLAAIEGGRVLMLVLGPPRR